MVVQKKEDFEIRCVTFEHAFLVLCKNEKSSRVKVAVFAEVLADEILSQDNPSEAYDQFMDVFYRNLKRRGFFGGEKNG